MAKLIVITARFSQKGEKFKKFVANISWSKRTDRTLHYQHTKLITRWHRCNCQNSISRLLFLWWYYTPLYIFLLLRLLNLRFTKVIQFYKLIANLDCFSIDLSILFLYSPVFVFIARSFFWVYFGEWTFISIKYSNNRDDIVLRKFGYSFIAIAAEGQITGCGDMKIAEIYQNCVLNCNAQSWIECSLNCEVMFE